MLKLQKIILWAFWVAGALGIFIFFKIFTPEFQNATQMCIYNEGRRSKIESRTPPPT